MSNRRKVYNIQDAEKIKNTPINTSASNAEKPLFNPEYIKTVDPNLEQNSSQIITEEKQETSAIDIVITIFAIIGAIAIIVFIIGRIYEHSNTSETGGCDVNGWTSETYDEPGVTGWDTELDKEYVASTVDNEEVKQFILDNCSDYYDSYEVAECWRLLSTTGKVEPSIIMGLSFEYESTARFEMEENMIRLTQIGTDSDVYAEGFKTSFWEVDARDYTITEFCQFVLDNYREVVVYRNKNSQSSTSTSNTVSDAANTVDNEKVKQFIMDNCNNYDEAHFIAMEYHFLTENSDRSCYPSVVYEGSVVESKFKMGKYLPRLLSGLNSNNEWISITFEEAPEYSWDEFCQYILDGYRESEALMADETTGQYDELGTILASIDNQDVVDFILNNNVNSNEADEIAYQWEIIESNEFTNIEVLLTDNGETEVDCVQFEMRDNVIKLIGDPRIYDYEHEYLGVYYDFDEDGAQEYSVTDFCQFVLDNYREVEAFEHPESVDTANTQANLPPTNGKVRVELGMYGGDTMTAEYPKHDAIIDGKYVWRVNVHNDGTVITENGDEYSYIFWESEGYTPYAFKDGFCVKGEDTEEFLKSSLQSLNLLPREYNEFIVYWLPQMQNNEYNIVRFYGIDPSDTTDPYLNSKPLEVYDSNNQLITNQLRVFMVWYSSDKPIDLPEQELEDYAIVRDDVTPTVIEWGGTVINGEDKQLNQ